MTSQTITTKFIPSQFIARPNFDRGTMGKDISSAAYSPVGAQVIDKK